MGSKFMPHLDMRRKDTLALMNHPVLRGLKSLDRGRFSMVFDKSKLRIIKATMCPASYAYLVNANTKPHKHFPKVHVLHGEIGEVNSNDTLWDVNAATIERLAELPMKGSALRLGRRISKDVRKNIEKAHKHFTTNPGDWQPMDILVHAFESVATNMEYEPSIRDAFQQLVYFVDSQSWVIYDDFELRNFMVRPNGTLILNDPFFSDF